MFGANTYYRWAGLSPEERIEHIQSLLKGKAAHFYMQNVAKDPSKWTMARLGRELFDYCFPRNFLELIQRRFDSLTQGRKLFLDYIRNIERMAERAPDVDDAQMPRKLFEGVNGYLRIGWRQRGMSAALTSFEDLKESGLDIESTALQTVYEGLRAKQPRRDVYNSIGECPSIETATSNRKYGFISHDQSRKAHRYDLPSTAKTRTYRHSDSKPSGKTKFRERGRTSKLSPK